FPSWLGALVAVEMAGGQMSVLFGFEPGLDFGAERKLRARTARQERASAGGRRAVRCFVACALAHAPRLARRIGNRDRAQQQLRVRVARPLIEILGIRKLDD